MTSAEARDLANKQNARGWVFDIVDALAALESFCEGLKGVNDDLRGKLAECEKDREEANNLVSHFRTRYQAAEEDVRILTEASRANEDMIERARGSVPVEKLEALPREVAAVLTMGDGTKYTKYVVDVDKLDALLAECKEDLEEKTEK